MLTVHIASPTEPAFAVVTPGSERLLDVCDEAAAPIFYSCRSARCGVCLVEVSSGREHLEPPESEERSTLADIGASATQRLACQVRLGAGTGEVRLIALRSR